MRPGSRWRGQHRHRSRLPLSMTAGARLPAPLTADGERVDAEVRAPRPPSAGWKLPLVISDHADWKRVDRHDSTGESAGNLDHSRPAKRRCCVGCQLGQKRRAAARLALGGLTKDEKTIWDGGNGRRRLLDALIYTTSRNRKLALIADYLRSAPDPDRGWALDALTGGLDFPAGQIFPTIRNLMMERVDPVLWALFARFRRRYRGDGQPAVARAGDTGTRWKPFRWPRVVGLPCGPHPHHCAPGKLPALLDRMDAKGRYALIKLATGGDARGDLGAGWRKTAFAQAF